MEMKLESGYSYHVENGVGALYRVKEGAIEVLNVKGEWKSSDKTEFDIDHDCQELSQVEASRQAARFIARYAA